MDLVVVVVVGVKLNRCDDVEVACVVVDSFLFLILSGLTGGASVESTIIVSLCFVCSSNTVG